jgi:histidinol phosphatase-like enzyme
MLEQAIKDFPEIKIKSSFLVGDSDSDIEAGNKFGLQTVKVDGNYTLYHWLQEISL